MREYLACLGTLAILAILTGTPVATVTGVVVGKLAPAALFVLGGLPLAWWIVRRAGPGK